MGVVCFSSLKGGVGKTTLSLNVATAFAVRGCETLVVDLDPAAHASNFLSTPGAKNHVAGATSASVLARLLCAVDLEAESAFQTQMLEQAMISSEPVWESKRDKLFILPAGAELRHFLWGKGARVFKTLFPILINILRQYYDYIIIDTPPDYNVLTRNAIGQADLVVVPVDASAMSVNCLEQLIENASHIKTTSWSIVRTMVNRQATRLRKDAESRLNENLHFSSTDRADVQLEEDEFAIENPDEFIAMLDRHENQSSQDSSNSPIFLLNSMTYRSEQQNRLSFAGKTCFDSRSNKKMATQYLSIAREIDTVLGLTQEEQDLADVVQGMDISAAAV